MVVSHLSTLGSALTNPDFAVIAEACVGVGLRVESLEQLEKNLNIAFQQDKPVIVDIHTANFIVPHTKI
ncbi:MAG: pyruvate oxidase [Bacilli bacterium]|nr:pyruvate oxidase [Bacilli bacterium]